DHAVYTLHGPVEQNHHEIVETMSGVLGIPVHYEPISIEEFATAMRERGHDEHLVQHLSNVAVDYQNGVFAGTNDNIAKLGGQPPLSVEQYVRENLSAFETSGSRFVPAP
ncbi:hypothetical protein, partial [Pseudonocardia alaniniphila]